jgi:hypothetical protein
MDYKGFNIAMHELGHNVEQVFSGCKIDHTALAGVPNTAFTEGFAFVFQERDLDVLGMPNPDPNAEHLKSLDDFWATCEIAAVSLVDMRVWHWMYDHPDATPSEFKEAVIGIAKDVWNEYYAPAFGIRDVDILAIYTHMISGAMYLPDYPLGHIIAFQVKQYFKTRKLSTEMERMCLLGSITPELWMQQAVGGSISTEPLLSATRAALAAVQ